MHIHALITDQIVARERPMQFISYSREGDSVFLMVSHSATWELGRMRRMDWDTFLSDFPAANVDFHEGDHLLELNPTDNTWRDVPQ